MPGFTKLFGSIITSSIWCQDDVVLRVWIAMLALCDATGVVEGTVPGFANLARVTVPKLIKALAILTNPDPHSRTKDLEGRRLVEIPGGWQIVNYVAYRDRAQGKEGSRAPYLRQYRLRKKCIAIPPPVSGNTEAEGEGEGEGEKTRSSSSKEELTPTPSQKSKKTKAPMMEAELRSALGDHYDTYLKVAAIFGPKKFKPVRDVPLLLKTLEGTSVLQVIKTSEIHRSDALEGPDGNLKYMKQFCNFVADGLHLVAVDDHVGDAAPSGSSANSTPQSSFSTLAKAKAARLKGEASGKESQ
jgi:hypothetical protein